MAFVNEFIPAEDVEKYDIAAIDEKFVVGRTRARDWTIDRDRDIYLRNVAMGAGADPDFRNQTTWTFYWHGDLLTLRLDLVEGRGGPGEAGWSHWQLVRLNGTNGLPTHLKGHRADILETMIEALTAYEGAGVYSANYSSYSVTLNIAEGCTL